MFRSQSAHEEISGFCDWNFARCRWDNVGAAQINVETQTHVKSLSPCLFSLFQSCTHLCLDVRPQLQEQEQVQTDNITTAGTTNPLVVLTSITCPPFLWPLSVSLCLCLCLSLSLLSVLSLSLQVCSSCVCLQLRWIRFTVRENLYHRTISWIRPGSPSLGIFIAQQTDALLNRVWNKYTVHVYAV